MKHIVKNLFFLLTFSLLGAGTMYAATAAKGVFSVAENKTVQFANANETGLVQWSTANAWREEQKNAEGHNGWYVLSHEEWTYLLVTRDGDGMSKNALGTVAGDSGLVILPDNWLQPLGVPEYKPVSEGYDYKNNIYTAAEWELMAQSGAVFLPCKGYSSNGTIITNAKDHGAYWSSDQYSDDDGYCVHFNTVIHDQNNGDKDLYYSVRLVKQVTVTELDENDESEAFATKLAAADDYNFAYVHRTMAKDNTLYTLCLPFDVPNVDASPLAGAEIYEFTGGHVSGSTGNERLHLNMKRLEGKRLTRGTPYILRWLKSGAAQNITRLCFYNVENWDNNTDVDTLPGDTIIKFQGVYPKAAIPGYTSGSVAHYNFFLGANNTLYWPDDSGNEGEWALHMMKGFRAYFYIVHEDPDPDPAPRYRNMPTVWDIEGGLGSTTDLDNGEWRKANGESRKELREGQIILIIDGEMYDLQGRRL